MIEFDYGLPTLSDEEAEEAERVAREMAEDKQEEEGVAENGLV